MEYVYFYINTVFGLHGMYMVAIYFTSWLISGTWLAGALGTAFYAYNRYAINLVTENIYAVCLKAFPERYPISFMHL